MIFIVLGCLLLVVVIVNLVWDVVNGYDKKTPKDIIQHMGETIDKIDEDLVRLEKLNDKPEMTKEEIENIAFKPLDIGE